MISVALTDDHELVMQGIENMLHDVEHIEVTHKYTSIAATIDGLSKQQPDILLLDINLPDGNGIDFCKKAIHEYPKLKIIALSSYGEIPFVKRILANGAKGYLLKNTSKEELLQAFATVMQNLQYLQTDIQKKLMQSSLGKKQNDAFIPKLTRREKEVLSAIARELTTQEIANDLCISTKTVETHRMNLISKLGARNSVGLVRLAIEKGLLTD